MRKILVAFADTHGGHKLGLLMPGVELYDEDERGNLVRYRPSLTATQRYLHNQYLEDIAAVQEIAGDDPIVVLHNGDATHGDKYPQQLVGTRAADQILIAVANMQQWLEIANVEKFRVVQGTAAHNYAEGTADILINAQLEALYPLKDIGTLNHSLASVDGVRVDYAHHGPGAGIRNWTRGNVARYYLRSLMMDDIVRGREPPRLVLRAHFHQFVHEVVSIPVNGREIVSEIYILPCYCGMSEHGRQVTRSRPYVDTGVIVWEIEDGRIVGTHPFWREMDLRTEEEL